jgi:hypothetical protein
MRPPALRMAFAAVPLVAACATAPTPVRDLPAALAYGPACAGARARALASPAPDGLAPARPRQVVLPPQPVPRALRGETAVVTVRVDSAGVPTPEGIRVAGLTDASYAARLRAGLRTSRYWPAALEGCAVESTITLQYHL